MTIAPADPRVGRRWFAGYGAAWLGVWLAQLTVVQLLLPEQVAAVAPGAGGTPVLLAFGGISALAGVAALVVLPVVGAASDRTRSPLGRRRPWVAGGTLVFAGGLVLLGAQQDLIGVAVGWTLALAGFAAAAVGLTAMIADRVPVDRRGVASALVSAPQAAGTVLGLAVVVGPGLSTSGSYAVVAALLVVLVGVGLPALPDGPAPQAGPTAGVREVRGDFGWTLAGRLLVNLGNAAGTTLLLYFLADGLRVPDPEGALLPLVLVYLVCLLVATAVCGRASDLSGRRRPFVAAAAGLQAVAAAVLAVAPAYGPALAAAALLGAGYGVFLSVDQALATQVLPQQSASGRDLGFMTAASAVPQAFGPIVGAAVVLLLGYPGLFAVAAALSAAGAACVARVRSVA